MDRNMSLRAVEGVEGFNEEELRSLMKEVAALRARMHWKNRTLGEAERLFEASRAQLDALRTELYAGKGSSLGSAPGEDALAVSSQA